MRVRHPYSLDDDAPEPDATVHYGGRREWAAVEADGTFEVPDDKRGWLDGYADSYGYSASALIVDENGESGRTADASPKTTDGSDGVDSDGTCAATTADDQPCSNPAGEDGYCHLASHGPEA